jgi:hypothetical protein
MTRVFISYSRHDKTMADYIAAELRRRDADVFVDYQKLVAGENFIARLGREIEARDFFVLLLSPRSVVSKWVQAEAAWALHCNKPIIPIRLEPASLTDFFFLINLEQIDFTRWSVDGQVGEALGKLARALGLPDRPTQVGPAPELLVAQPAPSEEAAAEEEPASAPTFGRGDLSELFMTAAEVADQDPEQALFLYRRVLEIDPGYMAGQARAFVQREEARLKPARLARLQAQAEGAMRAGEWGRGERLGRDMLAFDAEHAGAQRIVALCVKNAEGEPLYRQATVAAAAGRWRAVATLLRDVKASYPDYSDPAGLLRGRPIQAGLAAYVHELVTLAGHSDRVMSVAFSPGGALLASASTDGTVKLWEMPGGRELAALASHSSVVASVTFPPDGALLASPSDGGTVKLWAMPGGRELATLAGHSGPVSSVAFSPDGALLASASYDGTVKLWEMPGGREAAATLAGHRNVVTSVAFSPDGALLASASADQTIRLWEMPGGRELTTRTGYDSAVMSVAFSPDGGLLASASSGTVKLWAMPGGRELATLAGHSGPVSSVAFSPDGALLASASHDWTVKLWEMPGGREAVATLAGHRNVVTSVAFSPDGALLASASADWTVKLWGLG